MKIGEQAPYLARLKGLNRHDAMHKIKDWFKRLEMDSGSDRNKKWKTQQGYGSETAVRDHRIART